MECPNCKFQLKVETSIISHDTISVRTAADEVPNNILRECLLSYWRWVVEGKQPYWQSVAKPGQMYYDDYHQHIEYMDGKYRFSIQTFDSPEGDQWWRGSFRLGPRMIIEELVSE